MARPREHITILKYQFRYVCCLLASIFDTLFHLLQKCMVSIKDISLFQKIITKDYEKGTSADPKVIKLFSCSPQLRARNLSCVKINFSIISLWELYVAMATRVPIKSVQKPTVTFPLAC